MIQIHIFLSTISLTHHPDSFVWSVNGSPSSKFSTKLMYNILKDHREEVTWEREVWFSGCIPRHAFLTWLFMLNRCPTRDRMRNWGLPTSPLCLLCSRSAESRDHIFFECDFSWTVWNRIRHRLHLGMSKDWNSIILDMQNIPNSSPRKTLTGLAWQSSIYLIWSERNNRLHSRVLKPPATIVSLIDRTIRNRASSLREDRPPLCSSLLQLWFEEPPPPP